jgi:hypothetical protein
MKANIFRPLAIVVLCMCVFAGTFTVQAASPTSASRTGCGPTSNSDGGYCFGEPTYPMIISFYQDDNANGSPDPGEHGYWDGPIYFDVFTDGGFTHRYVAENTWEYDADTHQNARWGAHASVQLKKRSWYNIFAIDPHVPYGAEYAWVFPNALKRVEVTGEPSHPYPECSIDPVRVTFGLIRRQVPSGGYPPIITPGDNSCEAKPIRPSERYRVHHDVKLNTPTAFDDWFYVDGVFGFHRVQISVWNQTAVTSNQGYLEALTGWQCNPLITLGKQVFPNPFLRIGSKDRIYFHVVTKLDAPKTRTEGDYLIYVDLLPQ